MRGSAHRLQNRRRSVLEGDVEVGKDPPLGHQRDHAVDVRVRVDVVQARPDAERAECAREVEEARLQRHPLPGAFGISDIEAVGAGVLADDEQLLDARFDEALGLGHHLVCGTARKVSAQVRNDAEAAAVVAALRDLQIGVVARREAQALRRHEVEVGVVQRRHRIVHGGDDLLVLVRTGDGEHARVRLADAIFLDAHASGDDDAAVLGQRLADGIEAFLLGAVEEAAGIHDHDVGAGVVGGDPVAFGAQLGDDALAVDQRLRAAERDEADLRRRLRRGRCRGCGRACRGFGSHGLDTISRSPGLLRQP